MPTSFLAGYLPYLLQRTDQLLSARFHRSLRSHGVHTSEWRVLAILHDHGPLTMGTLTRETLLPQPTATHAVARLEQLGAVQRRAGQPDGRHRIVELTSEGLRRAEELVAAADADLAATLDEAAIEVPPDFVAGLDAMMRALDRERAKPTG